MLTTQLPYHLIAIRFIREKTYTSLHLVLLSSFFEFTTSMFANPKNTPTCKGERGYHKKRGAGSILLIPLSYRVDTPSGPVPVQSIAYL